MVTLTKMDLGTLRRSYLEMIERLAEQYRPCFESGELHGFTDEDSEKESADENARMRDIEAGKPNRCRLYVASIWRWEEEIKRSVVRTFSRAYVIVASSPTEKKLEGNASIAEIQNLATQCITWDVMRIARSRGWYKPTKGEEPTNAQLGLHQTNQRQAA